MADLEESRAIEEWQQAIDRLDQHLAKAVNAICRRAGGENDDPSPKEVREILREHGLMVRFRPTFEKVE